MKQMIFTDKAPKAIGVYSQAIKAGHHIYVSGQIGLDPQTMQLCSDDIEKQTEQVFNNLQAIVAAAGAQLNNILKITIYLVDLNHFAKINEIMSRFFTEPYPARACVEVSALPKNALIEMDAIVYLND